MRDVELRRKHQTQEWKTVESVDFARRSAIADITVRNENPPRITTTMLRVNYTSGYVVYNQDLCYESWLLLPAENLWPAWVRGILYVLAIFYLFLGIAIAADVFMLSIEMITSKKRIIFTYDYEKGKSVEKEVYVWNETVANLTLMALGSSAPEILIAVIETLTSLDVEYNENSNARDLGTFTIIGSAAYNLLMISAVCIISVPSKTVKRIGEFGVFVVTSIWSLFAYFWLIVVLKWSSPNEVEVWEAVLTLAFFPLLVISAWCQDRGWWRHKFLKKRHSVAVRNPAPKASQPYSGSHVIGVRPAEGRGSFNFDPEVTTTTHGPSLVHRKQSDFRIRKLSESKSKLRNIVSYVKDHEANGKATAKDIVQGIKQYMEPSENKSLARARFRHAAVSALIKGKHVSPVGKSSQLVCKALKEDSNKNISTNRHLFLDHGIGNFSFSSSSYSVVRSSGHLDVTVLFHVKRRRKVIGFSHIVEAAKRANTLGETVQLPRPELLKDRGESSCHSVASQKTVVSTIDEFDDAFNDIAYHHSFSNSDSGFVASRSSEERSPNQANTLGSIYESRNRPSQDGIEMTDLEKGVGKLVDIRPTIAVEFETRDGTAKQGRDYEYTEGSLTFTEQDYRSSVSIPIKGAEADSNQEEKFFFIILKSSSISTGVGDPSVAKVSIIDDNEPGELMFQEATYHVDYTTGIVTANVVRIHGCDGTITAHYRTINGSAFGGSLEDLKEGACDFQEIKQARLEFLNGETSKEVKLRVNMNSKRGKSFILLLYTTSGGAKLGHRSAAIITLTSAVDEIVDQVANIMTEETKEKSVLQLWNEQLYDAMSIGDYNNNNDDQKPSTLNYILHFLTFFWKVLFSLIPPRTLFGGWLAFILSLMFLGLLSAFVEQFAKLLGCVFNLEISVTGITIVALGTSMPDTFASRSAAVQDDTADASIGNITGSNSVNVFLGLGLPWVIKTIYYKVKGKDVKVIDSNLTFSVTVFLCCGIVCLMFLVLRRKLFGGELGGPRWAKFGSGLALMLLWAVFVVLCSCRAYDLLPAL